MEQIILVVHLLVSLAIIGLIMMQRGKGSDIGASFGAGASQTLLGSAGNTNILTKGTAWLVVIFLSTSFGLAMIADSRTAGEGDLGFELPIDSAPAQILEFENELPQIDADSSAPGINADMPVLESERRSAVDANGDMPEG